MENKELLDSRWIRCPSCKGKTRTKVYASTIMMNFPLFCPKCKNEFLIDVVQLRMLVKNNSKLGIR